MSKYLVQAIYTAEGAKGLVKAGGTARRAAVQKMVQGLGGRVEAFYFAFGENDAYLILDVPDNLTAAAISLAVASTGAVSKPIPSTGEAFCGSNPLHFHRKPAEQ
jgi:uncharacterized protein with GYD domain